MRQPLPWLASAGAHELPGVAALAFLGDAVHGLYIRGLLLQRGIARSGPLHEAAMDYVRAEAQARVWRRLQPSLTEAERDLCRRAFNSHHLNKPKGVPGAEYRAATAFEALLGMLYWTGEMERLTALLELAVREETGTASDDPDLVSTDGESPLMK